VYARTVKGEELSFGVSGLLYKANVLMYDHQSESLWSQVKRTSVTGPMTGTKLKVLPSSLTTWGRWSKRHPDTQVLSFNTGHSRDYSRDPYGTYRGTGWGRFLSNFIGRSLDKDEVQFVVGVQVGDSARAYPMEQLRKTGSFSDNLGGVDLLVQYDSQTDKVTVSSSQGDRIEHLVVYWFVFKETHPEAALFEP